MDAKANMKAQRSQILDDQYYSILSILCSTKEGGVRFVLQLGSQYLEKCTCVGRSCLLSIFDFGGNYIVQPCS